MMYFRHVEMMAHWNPLGGPHNLPKQTVRTVQRLQFIHTRNTGLDKIVKSAIKLLSKISYFCVFSRWLYAVKACHTAQWLSH
jgi:hypothetical protein